MLKGYIVIIVDILFDYAAMSELAPVNRPTSYICAVFRLPLKVYLSSHLRYILHTSTMTPRPPPRPPPRNSSKY